MCKFLPSPIICGILFLISEVVRCRPDLGGLSATTSSVAKIESTSNTDLSRFDDEDDEEKEETSSSWVHTKNLKTQNPSLNRNSGDYDPCHRNPAFCGAEKATLWELESLSAHCHPSVALFAQNLLDGVRIKYSGDPLQVSYFFCRKITSSAGKLSTSSVGKLLPLSDNCQLPLSENKYITELSQRQATLIPQREISYQFCTAISSCNSLWAK